MEIVGKRTAIRRVCQNRMVIFRLFAGYRLWQKIGGWLRAGRDIYEAGHFPAGADSAETAETFA